MTDEKYITFKKVEFETWLGWLADQLEYLPDAVVLPAELDDCVVIRTQDVFAGPALHAYASSISVAIQILREFGHTERADRLQAISDYLFQRAEEADAQAGKLPD